MFAHYTITWVAACSSTFPFNKKSTTWR